jgi:hypothetical protein
MITLPSKDNANRAYDVLLLDFGGVCLFTPFELNSFIETAAGLPQGSITSMGPFDPSTDDLWTELFSSDTLRERDWRTSRHARNLFETKRTMLSDEHKQQAWGSAF